MPDFGGLPYHGHVLCAHLPNYSFGVYLVSGTLAQLNAINALPNVYALCRADEFETVITATRRTRINTWLTARGYPTIPAGWSYRQVVLAVGRRLLEHFDIAGVDIADPEATP